MMEEFKATVEDRGIRQWEGSTKRYTVTLTRINPENPTARRGNEFYRSSNFKWLAIRLAKNSAKSWQREQNKRNRAKVTEHRIKL